MIDISVVVVNWNACDFLRKCLHSVMDTLRGISYEMIVVDNGSKDGSASMVRENFPSVRLIENLRNRGFGAANNQALQVMKGRYALLLNSDAVLMEGAAWELYSFMEGHAGVGMACGQLLNPDGSKQNSVAAFPSLVTLLTNAPMLEYLFPNRYPSKRYSHREPIEVESGIGACLIVRREAMDAVGLFDERYFFFLEETDWAYRMRRAGWKVFHVPGAKIYHYQGQSIGHHIMSRIAFYRARYQFLRKWHSLPYFLFACLVIFSRLTINWMLTTVGATLTLGLVGSLRGRWLRYSKLILWHFYRDFA
jgi:hypothetical protein